MGLLGPKGRDELDKTKKAAEKKWKADASTKAELENTPGSQLKIVMIIKVTMISEEETAVKAIDCTFKVPRECTCNEHTYKSEYKVDYEAQSYVISPNIVGFSAPPDAHATQGSDYTGSSYGSFTVKDEIVKEVTVDCPAGMFDLPKMPSNLASLAPDAALRHVVTMSLTARFAYLGTIIGGERTTMYRRASKVGRPKKATRGIAHVSLADWVVEADKHPSRGLTSTELATWNHIEDLIGPYLMKTVAASRDAHSRS